MERLIMHIILDIIYRLRAGQSVREIARDLGHSRDTVRKYRNLAEAKGYLNIEQELPDEEIVSGELPSSLPTPDADLRAILRNEMRRAVLACKCIQHRLIAKWNGHDFPADSIKT